VHRSKGLEADVVFLFGGTSNLANRDPVCVFHDQSGRRVAIGKDQKAEAKKEWTREEREEDERLMYVALTRARVKLYLPFFPANSLKTFSGYYKNLNNRLCTLIESDRSGATGAELFDIEAVRESSATAEGTIAEITGALANWVPPAALIDDTHDNDARTIFDEMRGRHAPLQVLSYTAIRSELELEDFKASVDTLEQPEIADLPGGRDVGIFLHEAIEKLDLKSFGEKPNEKDWMARDDVRDLFVSTMRRHGVGNPRWLDRGREIVFRSLTSPIAIGASVLESGLHVTSGVREMEFIYPIPETHHRMLGSGGNGAWRVERGYLKGFIDYIFQHEGKTYLADWKSDLLPSYESNAVSDHVELHYSLQAQIYSVGVVRMLGIRTERDYEKFGGLLYVFLRGVGLSGDATSGIYFARPTWNEIVNYESNLIATSLDEHGA
jgi:exodeoxyribonuclease V beta subunit